MDLVFAVNPILATGGQIAAIIIGVYILIFVLLALVFNIVMAFGLVWLREKSNAVKMLRPVVESINKTTEAATRQGIPLEANQEEIVRAIVKVPVGVHNFDKQVDKASDRVASTVIEFYARVAQAKATARAFLLPGLAKSSDAEKSRLRSRSSRVLKEKHTPKVPTKAESEEKHVQPEAGSQLSNVLSR